jgi:drug/metabolite transporter (DMT)-like permease
VFGWLQLGEVPTRQSVLVSVIALVGVSVMVGFGKEGDIGGDLLAVGMTAAMAFCIVIVRKHPAIPAMAAAFWATLLSGLVCLPFIHDVAVSGRDVILLAAFGLVNSALGLALFTVGARWVPPFETALIGTLEAPLALLWVWMAFAEIPGRSTAVGGAIVFAAVAIHLMRSARGQFSAPPSAETTGPSECA